jgi:two-component system LytT family sensor kinase
MLFKVKTNTILPIILAAILPFFRFYFKGGEYGDISLAVVWLLLSLVLYFLWYFLWCLWDIRTNSKIIWQTLGLLLIIIVLMSINHQLLEVNADGFQKFSIVRLVVSSILYLSIQYAMKSQEKVSRLFLEKEQLQTEHYKTQLQALRSKVDPHFLFNTLNTLRIMVRNKHEGAEKFVMSLSDFYRQTLQFNENSTILLEEELEVLEAYLFLMKSRNQAGLTVEMEIDETLYQRFIPTLALQVVTENCFKHNTMSADEPLYIFIENIENNYISIRNNIQPKLTLTEPSGHGLKNMLKRYELLGVENGVKIQQRTDFFEVQLKLI